MFGNLVHLKGLLMVLTAAAGTIAGGTMVGSFLGSKTSASFLVTLNPSTITVEQLATSASTVTVTSVDGYSGTVGLSLYYPGQKVTSSLSPTSLTISANGQAHSTLSITAPNATGTYTIVVIGLSTSHGKTVYSTGMLQVQVTSKQDFSITASNPVITNYMGSSNTTTISVSSLNGYTGNVSLTVTSPFGYITVTGGQNTLALTSGGTATSVLTISTSSSTALGSYTLVVTGTDGSHAHKTTITLNVLDPVPVENLVMTSYHFVNGTDLVLNLQNTGNVSIRLQSYTVQDGSGDAWTMNNLGGPTIAQGTSGTATILIGSSCPTCIYSGITGFFFQYQTGHTYTVVLSTTRSNQFTFTVTM